MYVVAISTFTHSGMLEAEAWSTSLRILGVQIKVAQFTPERKTQKVTATTLQPRMSDMLAACQ